MRVRKCGDVGLVWLIALQLWFNPPTRSHTHTLRTSHKPAHVHQVSLHHLKLEIKQLCCILVKNTVNTELSSTTVSWPQLLWLLTSYSSNAQPHSWANVQRDEPKDISLTVIPSKCCTLALIASRIFVISQPLIWAFWFIFIAWSPVWKCLL